MIFVYLAISYGLYNIYMMENIKYKNMVRKNMNEILNEYKKFQMKNK